MSLRFSFLLPLLTFAALPTSASGADIVFTGTLINSCVLNISTPGVLGAASDGTTLTSEGGTGVAAVMAVVAVGSRPTLTFTAPTLQTPNGFSGSATTAVRLHTLSGASQPYTTGAGTIAVGALLDTVTINSRVTNPDGFASGAYSVRTVVTCQQ
jgi:hypothetical protein